MKVYMMKMKWIRDTLVACGRAVSKEDQVLSIFASLGPELVPTVAVLTSRIDSYNIWTASALILASENLDIQQSITLESLLLANVAFRSKKSWHNNSGH